MRKGSGIYIYIYVCLCVYIYTHRVEDVDAVGGHDDFDL